MAKAEWNPRRLDDLGFVGRGKSRYRPRNEAKLFGGPYPFVQTADVMGADPYITSYSQTYSEFGLQQSKMWPAGTLCMTIAGANTAKTAILRIEACFPDSIVGFIPDKSKADLYFVKYSLDLMRDRFLSVSRGATQDNLSLDKLLSFPIAAPDVDEQRRIGGILSAYDNLIGNNTRRIKILEEMAQRLYREWFVHFRFRGRENVKLVDGDIPGGWELKKLGDVSDILMGQSPRSEFYNETRKGLPFHQGVTNFGDRFPVDRIYCTVENRIAEEGDILFSVRAPVGRLNIADKKIVIGRGLCAIRSKTDNQPFVFQQLTEKFQEEDTMGGGTIFKSVTKDDMHGIEMLWPDETTLAQFDECVKPIFLELQNLTWKNANLRRTRDLLLPKLISGEVNMEE